MSKAIEHRLSGIERRLTPPKEILHVITVSGGFAEPIGLANGGGRKWEQNADEPFEAFEERVIADAKAARLKQVIIVPPDGEKLGTSEEPLSRYDFREVPPEEAH